MARNILENLEGEHFRKTQLVVGITGLGMSIYLMQVKLPFYVLQRKVNKKQKRSQLSSPLRNLPRPSFLLRNSTKNILSRGL